MNLGMRCPGFLWLEGCVSHDWCYLVVQHTFCVWLHRTFDVHNSTQTTTPEAMVTDTTDDTRHVLDEEELELDEERAQRLWRKIADDPELASKVLKAVDGIVPDIFKRSMLTGVGNLLLSEDGLRAMLLEKNLPKEAVGLILSQADVMRREILRIISREIRVFLENMDFGGEIAKILTAISFEIKTEIRFVPNDQAVKPNIKNRVKVKRHKEEPFFDDSESASDGLDESSGGLDEPSQADESGDVEKKPKGKRRRWTLLRKSTEDSEEDVPTDEEDEAPISSSS